MKPSLKVASALGVSLLTLNEVLSPVASNVVLLFIALSLPGAASKPIQIRFAIYAAFCLFLMDFTEVLIIADLDVMTIIFFISAIIELTVLFFVAKTKHDTMYACFLGVFFAALNGCMSALGVFSETIYNVGNFILPAVFIWCLCYGKAYRASIYNNDHR